MAVIQETDMQDPSSPIDEQPIHGRILEIMATSHLSLQHFDAFKGEVENQVSLSDKLASLYDSIQDAFRLFCQIASKSSDVARQSLDATAGTCRALSDGHHPSRIPSHISELVAAQTQAVEIHNSFRELRFSLHISIRNEASEPAHTTQTSDSPSIHSNAMNTLLKLLESTLRFSDWWKHRRMEGSRLHSLLQNGDPMAQVVCKSLKEQFETYTEQVGIVVNPIYSEYTLSPKHQVKGYQMTDTMVLPQLAPPKLILDKPAEIPEERMDVAVRAMSEITTATHKTFEHLKAFHEHFSIVIRKDKTKDIRLAHDRIVAQSHAYAQAISTSIGAAEQGFIVARNAIAILEEDLEANRTALTATMSLDVSAAHRKASETEEAFRNIRKGLYAVKSSIGGSYSPPPEPAGAPQGTNISVTESNSTPSMDLLQATLQVLDDLVEAIGRFVDWWAFISIENSRLSRITRVGSHASKGLWQSLEKHYSAYFTEIKRQQDYYASITTGLKKSSEGRTWFKGFNLITPFKSFKRPGRRGKSQHGGTQ